MSTTTQSVIAKFRAFELLLDALAAGRINALFAPGSAGVGKTHEATRCLTRPDVTLHRFAGRMTPLSLFKRLFETRTTRDVLMLDDCDDVFTSGDSLNLLKAACDSLPVRRVTWSSTKPLKGIPDTFAYAGRILILTNREMSDAKIAPLLDRAHVCPLQLTLEERVERVLMATGAICRDPAIEFIVSGWMMVNADALHALGRLTLRSVVKASQLARAGYRGDQLSAILRWTLLSGSETE